MPKKCIPSEKGRTLVSICRSFLALFFGTFHQPSAIQQRAVVLFINGGDIIAQAQSGTGKTGAFTVGLLQRVDFSNRVCQALVLSPTRELALQTEQVRPTPNPVPVPS